MRLLLTNVFDTDEVLAAGGVLWDSGRDPVPFPAAPSFIGKVGGGVTYALLEYLEPVTRSIVHLDVITWGPGHVHEAGT